MATIQSESVNHACNLCFRKIEKDHERFLVEGRGQFDVLSELKTLEFNVTRTSRFICRGCIQKLKKRRGLLTQLGSINSSLKSLHRVNVEDLQPQLKRPAYDIQDDTLAKKIREESTSTILLPCTSSPVSHAAIPQWPVSPVALNEQPKTGSVRRPLVLRDQPEKLPMPDQQMEPDRVDVSVKVKWPSKNKERKLPEDLESLGKMLVRGTYKQIANAAWKNAEIKKNLIELMSRDIDKECTQLCSKKHPSCLRKTDKESLLSFTMEKFYDELREKAPLFYSMLSAASVNSRSRSKAPQNEVLHAGTAMAAAVCLRNRSKFMIVVQLVITIFLYHSNWLSTVARLCTLRLTTSHKYLYKKLDEFGENHTKSVRDAVLQQGKYMAQKQKEKENQQSATSADSNHGVDMDTLLTQQQESHVGQHTEPQATPTATIANQILIDPDNGRKITFDNLDYRQEVHHMTEEHQNIDKHYVTSMSTENRVHGNHLSDKQPEIGVLGMENGKCLPTIQDHGKQRENYVTLAGRIISNNIPCLNFLSDVSTAHIPHQYSREMKSVSQTIFLGLTYENENDADGILNILRSLHEYVPFNCNEGEEKQYGEQGVVGDQLSVERAVNGHISLANGFTSEERLEGLHFEIADWHAGNKFLEVAFTNLYNPSSTADKCTMYSDRNFINRRNVKSDVSSAANPCRRFFQLEVEARIIAAAVKVLGMNSLDDEKPTKNVLADGINVTKQEKVVYLMKIASMVVDDYVIDQKRNEDILRNVQVMQHAQQSKDQEVNSAGRYRCRARGCSKTFAHDGKRRSEHEANHNPPVVVDKCSSDTFIIESNQSEDRDDMLAYQKALLDYGMLILNFWDAIAEGDGDRVLRCWKFFLMYLKHQGGSSTKYSLEALYLMFQVYALLSPQAAHRLIWNRSLKNKKGSSNIPLDLMLEFFNKTIKQAVKNLGPGASPKSLDRISNSLGFTVELLKVFDSSLSVFKRSGKHIKKSSRKDTEQIVKALIENNAFTFTKGRKYTSYANMKTSILCGFNLQKMFHWINEHKKYMILHRRAR